MSRKVDDPAEILDGWIGQDVEVLFAGDGGSAYLGRFQGKLGPQDGSGWPIGDGANEQWVAVPYTMREFELVKPDVLVMRHQDGETTIRLPDKDWNALSGD